MTFDEASTVVPAFARRIGPALLASRKAWDQLIVDLRELDIEPVAREAVIDAQQIWRGTGALLPGAHDGNASMGPRDDLDELIGRMAAGDAAAAEEWASAYRTWAAASAPLQRERLLPSPTDAEMHGPHTRYICLLYTSPSPRDS